MILKYSIAWSTMVLLAIINGIVREYVYGDVTSELTAHQISSVTIIGIFFIYTWILSSRWSIESSNQAFKIGFIWLGLTTGFEFLFGHFVMENPWEKLLDDYNIFAGRLWALVLAAVTLIPYLVYKIRTKQNFAGNT